MQELNNVADGSTSSQAEAPPECRWSFLASICLKYQLVDWNTALDEPCNTLQYSCNIAISGDQENGWKRDVIASDGSSSLHSDFSSLSSPTQQILEAIVPMLIWGGGSNSKFTSVVG